MEQEIKFSRVEAEVEFDLIVQELNKQEMQDEERDFRIERLEVQKELTQENLNDWDKLISALDKVKNSIKDLDIQNEIKFILEDVQKKKDWSKDILEEQEESIKFIRGY